jgi:hypothetical protein
MIQVDVTKEEITALRLINLHLGDAIFPMLKGDDVSELATARARLPGLSSKLAKYIADLDAQTVSDMAKKAEKKDKPKDPIKKKAE